MKQKKLLCAFLAATVALGLTACNLGQSGKTQEASYPITVGTANLAQQPDFVVSLSPMLTRTMEDLGLSGRLTGVSSFDQELTADWEDSPAFCGTAQLPDLDAIRGAKPALVLTQTPLAEHDLVKIQQMGAEVLVLSPATSIEGMKENYRQLFLALWGETEGARRSERFNQYLDRKIQTSKPLWPSRRPKLAAPPSICGNCPPPAPLEAPWKGSCWNYWALKTPLGPILAGRFPRASLPTWSSTATPSQQTG